MRFAPTASVASLALGVVALGGGGCRTPATQVDLRIDTPCRRPGQTLELTYYGADGEALDVPPELTRFEDVAWPHRQTLAPARQDPSRTDWRVRATLSEGARTLVTDELAGVYRRGETVTQELLLADPTCDAADAGITDASALDAGALDAAPDAFSPPLPGCEAREYTRAEEDLEILYVFDAGSGDSVPNSAPGGSSRVPLIGSPGALAWEGGTCARVAASPSPSASDGAAIAAALVGCRGSITIEAWLTVDSEPMGDAREEVFTHGRPGTEERGGFSLAIADGEFTATTNACDGQARPFYRFPRPTGLVHVVYTQAPIPLDAAIGPVDAGGLDTETWGFERAYVNGANAPLSISTQFGEERAGCVPEAPGLRRFGVSFPESFDLHLGEPTPWGAFRGCYHLLAIYCRALDGTEAHDNYCAGPP